MQAEIEKVWDVGEGSVTLARLRVNCDTGQTNTGRHNGRGDLEAMDAPSGGQVNNPNRRLLHLHTISVLQKASVNEPETVTGVVNARAIHGDDTIGTSEVVAGLEDGQRQKDVEKINW